MITSVYLSTIYCNLHVLSQIIHGYESLHLFPSLKERIMKTAELFADDGMSGSLLDTTKEGAFLPNVHCLDFNMVYENSI